MVLEAEAERRSTEAAADAQWTALQAVYRAFMALAKQFRYGQAPYEFLECGSAAERAEVMAAATEWLDRVDRKVAVHELRKLLHAPEFRDDHTIQALIARYLAKPERTGADRDKLDYLLAHFLREHSNERTTLEQAARRLEPLLGETSLEIPVWLSPLQEFTAEIERCATLRDLDTRQIIQRGRDFKVNAREMYFGPSALVAFAWSNCVLAANFARLLRADLQAIESLLDQLDSCGVGKVNCSEIMLGPAEPLESIRDMWRNWQRPNYQDYSDLSFQRIVKTREVLQAAAAAARVTPESRLRFLELRLAAITREVESLRAGNKR